MGRKLDLTNQKFGRLIALEQAPNKSNRTRWKCQCECGREIVVDTADLRRGHTISCGCFQKEQTSKSSLKDLTGKYFGFLEVLERDMNFYGKQIPSHWICLCHKCNEIKSISSTSLNNGTISCGCQKSKGEFKIMELLKENSISFISEYKFLDYRNRRFDFAILDENNKVIRLIEFDGIQHYYRPRANHWSASSTLEETQKRDKEKNEIAKQYNIPLVRIPYWHLDDITINMLLNDDKYIV